MYYINTKYRSEPVETADEFESHKEAQEMLVEYRMAFPEHDVWLSNRATKEWREK